jgi:hypothetical protein
MFDVAAESYDRFMGRYSQLLAGGRSPMSAVWSVLHELGRVTGEGALPGASAEVRERVGEPPIRITAVAWAARGRVWSPVRWGSFRAA